MADTSEASCSYSDSRGEGARDDAFDGARGVDRLRALQDAGISLSRNKNFALFSTPHHLSAIKALHYLDRLGRSMLRVAADGRGSITVDRRDDLVEVSLTAPWLSARRSAFLTGDELVWMGNDPEVGALLRCLGVALVAESSDSERSDG